MKEEKEYIEYVEKNIKVPDIKNRVKSKIEFKTRSEIGEFFMKKRTKICLSSALTLAAVTGIVVGVCVSVNQVGKVSVKNANALVNVDVNPSVEFAVDNQNKVVSVKGLNDEGMMMVYGEAFVGKDINDAVQALVKVETETGYLVVNGEASSNKISISVTADDNGYIEELQTKLSDSIKEECKKLNVDSTIETVEKYTKDEMVDLAMKCDSTLTKEEAENMTIKELSKVIALYHVETSDIYEQKVEDYYRQVRDSKIELSKYECIQKAIESADDLMKIALNAYNSVIDQIKTYYDNLDELTYTQFVDPESSYQKSLKEMNDAKDDVIKYRQQLASCDHTNEVVYNGLVSYLNTAESVLDVKIAALKSYEETGTFVIEQQKVMVGSLLEALTKVENMLSTDVKGYLNNKVSDLDKTINSAKDKAFEEFEKEHKDDILKAKEDVKNRKEKLKETIKNA